MSEIQVKALAKELGLSSKEIMATLQEFGIAITDDKSPLENSDVKLLRKKFAHLKPKRKVAAKKAKPRSKKDSERAEEKKEKKTKAKPTKKAATKAKSTKKAATKAKPAKTKATAKVRPKKEAEEKPTQAEAKGVVVEPPAPPEIEPPRVMPPKVEPPKVEPPKVVAPRRIGPIIVRPAPEPEEEKPEEKPEEKSAATKGGAKAKARDAAEAPAGKGKVKPVRKSRDKATEKQRVDDALLEDETELLLEEKRRIEQRVRQRERRKRKRLRERERARKLQKKALKPPPPSERLLRRRLRGPRKPVITVDEVMTVDELARRLKLKASALILELMQMDIMATKNQPLELEMVRRIAENHDTEVQVATSPEDLIKESEEQASENLQPRAPIVTVMGHVDHGKTALLDAIRKTNVIEGEAGGITQHIGAYEVRLDRGRITFLDTPGHEAFTSMRAHGAHVTDIVVLVVAADDGMMPQTMEAIDHARAAEVPIVVAINKMDVPAANIDRVKQQLSETDLTPEDWGGDTIAIPVSAKTKEGVDSLLEMLLLEAEMLDLKANPDRSAQGIVLEARLDRGRGPIATVLMQKGTLRPGDTFVVGTQYGKVRALLNDDGKTIAEAGPSTPVEVLGFAGVPEASQILMVVDDEKKARQIADSRLLKIRQKEVVEKKPMTLEDLYAQIQAGEIKELNVILKGDVQGSLTALEDSLVKLPTDQIRLNIIHTGVGAIKESDIILASASNALLIGFNVRPEAKARALAEKEKVDYRLYRVIYDLIADVRAAMEGLLEPEKREIFLGRAEVLQIFRVSQVGTVAGCRVVEGEVVASENVRLVRDGVTVYEGKMSSLKRYKEFARSAPAGTECGIGFENFNDVKDSDVVESYRIEEVARTL